MADLTSVVFGMTLLFYCTQLSICKKQRAFLYWMKLCDFYVGINRTALREIKLLQELKHPNIIGVSIWFPCIALRTDAPQLSPSNLLFSFLLFFF